MVNMSYEHRNNIHNSLSCTNNTFKYIFFIIIIFVFFVGKFYTLR